jgi:hypothetical protein
MSALYYISLSIQMSSFKKVLFGLNVGQSSLNQNLNHNTTSIEKNMSTLTNTESSLDNLDYKSPKEVFAKSKLYHKYLLTVKTKLTNSNCNKQENIKSFNECYDDANLLYEGIKKEWFWLENGDKMKQFKINQNSESIDIHKTKFYDNYQMLETIAKLYGFESWYLTYKNKVLQEKEKKQGKEQYLEQDLDISSEHTSV